MVDKAIISRDGLVPKEELAIFKFDEELALEEMRKPKAPKEVMNHRRVWNGRRTAKYVPQQRRAGDAFLARREHDTRMVNEVKARVRGQNAAERGSKAP
jgi:hypothetical protein